MPKDKLDGLIDMSGDPVDRPAPERLMVLFPALVTMVSTSDLFPAEVGLNARAISPDSPGARVLLLQAVDPMRNSVLLASVAEVTTRLAVPVFLTVSLKSLRVPTGTSPKPIVEDEGESVRIGAAAELPVPDRMTAIDLLIPSASMAIVPLLLPVEVGLNVTVTVADDPGSTVAELVSTEYWAEPNDTLMLVTLSGAVPVLLIVKVAVLDAPTATLPKARPELLIDIAGAPVEVPDPVSLTVFVPAFVATVSTSDLSPAEVGLNPRAISPDSPGARTLLVHADAPIRNSVLLASDAEVTTRAPVPVFFTVTLRSFLEPTATLPKLNTDDGDKVSSGVPCSTPTPVRFKNLESVSLASTVSLSLMVPLWLGLNITFTVFMEPGAMV